jgi:hypothetical protein
LVKRAKDVTDQMRVLAMAQRSGRLNKAAGAAEKASLRREILTGPEANKQVLVPYGLSAAVTVHLGELLDRFAKARELCDQGRVAHKAATQQLDELAQDPGSIIRTMDARNRLRYKDDPQMLANWIAASTVLGTRGPADVGEPAAPVAGGEVRPAA